MKRVSTVLAVLLTALAALCGFSACEKRTEPFTERFSVVFADGESRTEQTVEKGGSIVLSSPEREGYTFTGWWEGSRLAVSPFTPERDATLTAGWSRKDQLAAELKASLGKYLSSENFRKQVTSARTAQARVPLMYLSYLDKNYYTMTEATEFRQILSVIQTALGSDGLLDDALYADSKVNQSLEGKVGAGWYSYIDYLFTYSLTYNQYAGWLAATKNTDTTYDAYLPAIAEYLDFTANYIQSPKETFKPVTAHAAPPSLRVPFGYSAAQLVLMIAENLGLERTPSLDIVANSLASVYIPKEDGSYTASTGCNWVGFSGAPMARSLLRDNPNYSVNYEKSMQAYFPIKDAGMDQQGIDAMVNLDRLYEFYNNELGSGAGVAPQFALLTGIMHGIDMEKYVKSADPTGQVCNLITLWRENLKKDADGTYVIDNFNDMAVAIAYIAQIPGVQSPSPLGLWSGKRAVIGMDE